MCYPCGSADQTVNVCPMCKVFPHPKCPHRRDICRNRTAHPRFDVMFLKNAEVESFNGCGYCKWATFAQQKDSVAANPGWPGCCRAPVPSEYRYISVVDWKSVSTIYNIPIPPDVKATLDSIAAATPAARRASPGPGAASTRPPFPSPSSPSSSVPSPGAGNGFLSRSSPSSRTNSFSRDKTPMAAVAMAIAIPGKGKGSPKQLAATLGRMRSPTANGLSSSSPGSPSALDTYHHVHRNRQPIPDFAEREKEKKSDGSRSSQSSPGNSSRSLEADSPAAASPKRVSSIKKSSGDPASPTTTPTKAPDRPQDGSARRRSTISSNTPSPTPRTAAVAACTPRTPDPPRPSTSSGGGGTFLVPRSPSREDDGKSSTSSESGSSDSLGSGGSIGSGSLSDSTVISDGGFTDYLSDESEAELQRQAEARAALVAQNQMEEMEFKAARQRLAHVDLRPPKTWNPTNITNTPNSVRRTSGSGI